MILSDRQFFDSFFLPIIDSNTLAWKSPQLNFMASMSGVKIDRSPSGTYDTIIGEYDVSTPSHINGNLQTPAFWRHLVDASQYLSNTGKMIVKLPLMAIRFFKSKDAFNLSDLHILSGGEYLVATLSKTGTSKTHLTYEAEDFESLVDIKNDFILSSFKQDQQDFIESALGECEYDELIHIDGPKIKSGNNIDTYNRIVIRKNQNKISVLKMTENNLNSTCDVIVFSSEEKRDSYFESLNTKKVLDLQLSLSYNKTAPVSVIKLLLNTNILNYA